MSPSIQRIAERNQRNGSFDACFEAVCYAFEISAEDILGKGRSEREVWPRFTLIWLAADLTPESPITIAAKLKRSREMTPHALRAMRDRLDVDPKFKAEVEFLRDGLRRKFDVSASPQMGGRTAS